MHANRLDASFGCRNGKQMGRTIRSNPVKYNAHVMDENILPVSKIKLEIHFLFAI